MVSGGAFCRSTALQAIRSQVRSPVVSLEFFMDIILRATLWPRGSTQPRTKIKIRNICWGVQATFFCRLSWNLGASTSGNLLGLSRSVQGLLYLLPFTGTLLPCVLPLNLSTFSGRPETTFKYNSNSTCGALSEHLMFNKLTKKLSCLCGIPAFTFVPWIVSSVSWMHLIYLHTDFVSFTVTLSRSIISPSREMF